MLHSPVPSPSKPTSTTIFSNCSSQFQPHISIITTSHYFRPFPLHNSRYIYASRADDNTTTVNLIKHEEDTPDFSSLKHNIEMLGIKWDGNSPGQYSRLICPKCKGGKVMERSLSFYINADEDCALWRCFRFECGWADKVFADSRLTENRASEIKIVNLARPMTEETLQLEPLGDELIDYFAERRISVEVLQNNSVMQRIYKKNVVAFPYRRNGVFVGCKYRTITDRRYWQAKGSDSILYGLDGIMEAEEIIMVEGEIDKLSMEQAGIFNCVSVPYGAPQKVSERVVSLEKDTKFKYLWNCKEYLDKATRIILATDSDVPGQVLAEELARRLGKERCWLVTWPRKDKFSCFKDANEVLVNLGADALRHMIKTAQSYNVQTVDQATELQKCIR